MATFYVPSTTGWKEDHNNYNWIRLKVVQTYDANTNTSVLVITPQTRKTGDVLTYSVSDNTSLVVDGQTLKAAGSASDPSGYQFASVGEDWVDLTITASGAVKTFSCTVAHEDDGSASVLFATTWRFSGNSVTARTWANKTATLAFSEARLATVSAADGNFGQAVAITVTRRSTAYTHTVTALCLGQTETIVNKGTATSLSWTPALATYAPLIPNAMSASCTLMCTTYNGNTAIGTSSVVIVLSLRPQDVKPLVSIATADPMGYASTYGAFVATKSKIRVTLTNTLKYGASLVSTAISANGQNFNASPATTDVIASAANTGISASIIDSRGQSSGTQTATISILAYNAPKINGFSVRRCDSGGTIDDAGAYMLVSYNVAVTALNNHNSKALAVKYKKRSASSWTTQSVTMSAYTASGTVIITADVDSTYDVQLVVTDDFGSTTRSTHLPTAATFLNFQAGGLGLGIGKVSEIDKSVEIAADWTLYNGTKKIRPEALNLGTADAFVPENANFNSYITPGVYSVYTNQRAATISNIPTDRAGILIVYNSNGNNRLPGDAWYYAGQEYKDVYGGTWERKGNSDSNAVFEWSSWIPTNRITNFTLAAGKTATVSFASSEYSFLISANGYQNNIKAGLWAFGGYATASRGVLTQIVNSASSIVVTASADATYFTVANTSQNFAKISILAMAGTITGISMS